MFVIRSYCLEFLQMFAFSGLHFFQVDRILSEFRRDLWTSEPGRGNPFHSTHLHHLMVLNSHLSVRQFLVDWVSRLLFAILEQLSESASNLLLFQSLI